MEENKICICEFKNCGKFFENPILLPCGNTICRNHINEQTSEKISGKFFLCSLCDESHKIPDEGF